MIIIIEDLPEPEGPTTLTVSPGSTIRSRPRRMWTGPAAEGRVSSTDSSAIMALEAGRDVVRAARCLRSEEQTSELQSLMRISYAVFCLKKKKHARTAR